MSSPCKISLPEVIKHHLSTTPHFSKPLRLPAGLMPLAAALSFGATSVTITDLNPDNIKLAQKMGATNTHCHPRTATPPEIAEYLKKLLSPIGPEIVIDCVGFESTVQTAIR